MNNEQTQKENDVMARISYFILTMAHLGFFNLHHDIERQMKTIYKVNYISNGKSKLIKLRSCHRFWGYVH